MSLEDCVLPANRMDLPHDPDPRRSMGTRHSKAKSQRHYWGSTYLITFPLCPTAIRRKALPSFTIKRPPSPNHHTPLSVLTAKLHHQAPHRQPTLLSAVPLLPTYTTKRPPLLPTNTTKRPLTTNLHHQAPPFHPHPTTTDTSPSLPTINLHPHHYSQPLSAPYSTYPLQPSPLWLSVLLCGLIEHIICWIRFSVGNV